MAKRSISWRALFAKKLDVTEEWRKEHPELISGENSARTLLEKIKSEKDKIEVLKKKKQNMDNICRRCL